MADFDDTTLARFWSKVDKDGPVPEHMPQLGRCWTWTAARDKRTGYGSFNLGPKTTAAHRVSWNIHNGELPPDRPCVLHHCDTPPCVNPAHLWIGTQLDNIADRERKRRTGCGKGQGHGSVTKPWRLARGSKTPTSKLTEEKVFELRLRYAAGESCVALAREIGFSRQGLRPVLQGRSWTHVPMPQGDRGLPDARWRDWVKAQAEAVGFVVSEPVVLPPLPAAEVKE